MKIVDSDTNSIADTKTIGNTKIDFSQYELTDEEKIKFVGFLKLHGFDIKDIQNHIEKLVRELNIIDSRLSLLYSDLKTTTQVKKELDKFKKLFNLGE